MAAQVVTDSSSSVSVSFNPALWLQRQAFLLETLRKMGPNSVLDVGCGEGGLLECLARCDDALPLELLAGIDLSLDTIEMASASILATAELQQLDGRWRPLEVTLLHGTFTQLQQTASVFEAVTSSEVIEHLDPPDLARYWDIHLGVLKPNMLIVTTPNRDFNVIFETVVRLSGKQGQAYSKDGLSYQVRHDDHRFEYTCEEFEEKATKAAREFGYDVSFTGVGTPQNALNSCPELLRHYPDFLKLGYCTQAAIFTCVSPRNIPSAIPGWGSLEIIFHHRYERNVFTPFPPAPETLATSVGAMWRQFRPDFNSRSPSGFKPSSSGTIFGGVYTETDEGSVVCRISIGKLWDINYFLGKLFRFNKMVFSKVGDNLDGMEYDRGTLVPIRRLIKEFVGMETSGGSLRSFRFSRRDGEMCVLFDFWKDPPEIFDRFNASDTGN